MKLFGKILAVLVVVLAAGLGYWRYDHVDREHRPGVDALAAMESTSAVTVTNDEWIVFSPAKQTPTKGLIFYPGGECDERGYALPLRDIAAAGYLVVLVPMPLQLAVFAPDKANEVIAAHPEIQTWAIAGHSLGGSMAARYAYHHPDSIAGLMMWDAYAPDDMTASTLKVRMIHRSDQAGNPPPDYEKHLPKLPASTEFYPLKGAQHIYYGDFVPGRMYRDEPAPELDPAQQRELVAAESIDFMQTL